LQFLFENPGIQTPGFFIERKQMIDYKNLNDRIVRQAHEASRWILTEDLRTKMLQDKVQRAVEMLEARGIDTTYHQIED
jgi:hypothetical protein